eukprot:UN22644
MSNMKPQIRLFKFKYIFGHQVLTKCPLCFKMLCRPTLYGVYIRFWNYLNNLQLFSMNFTIFDISQN